MPPAHPADPDPGIRELLRGLPVFAGPLGVFEVAEAPDEPVALFRQWLAEAIDAGVPEPHATTLSTVDDQGRPSGSRAAALLERQSRPLADRSELDTELRRTRAAVERQPDLVAPSWRLYTVRADEVEFWQGDRERRHTRLRYQRTDVDTPTWHKEQLWP